MGRLLIIIGVLLAATALFYVVATSGGDAKRGKAQITGGDGVERPLKVLHLALDTDPKTLDPISVTDTISDGVARKIHNTLVRFEKGPDGALVVVGDLAEKWELSPDRKLYTFNLRSGVKFHNGREMKAEDAAYSLARLLSPESKRAVWLMPMVAGSKERFKDPRAPLGIRATGEYTMTIELTAAFAPFIQHLCTVNCAIVPKEAVEDLSKPFSRNPVGLGAFKLVEWKNSNVLVLQRNEAYHRGVPKLNELRFHIVKDPNTRLEQYFAGQLDACDIPFGRMQAALERAGEKNTLTYETYRTNYMGIGMPNGKFTNKADLAFYGSNQLLRQAINYAIDRQYLCDVVLEGRGVPAKGVLPPGIPGFKEGRPGWTKDVAKAKALLAEAGYPEGKGLPVIALLHRNDPNTKQIAQALSNDLAQVGIKVELQAREWNSFVESVEIEPKPMFLLGWVADYPDPDNFLYVLFNSKQFGSAGNHTWYANPKVDALTEKARALVEMKDRMPLYWQAEDIILDECPWICTYHTRAVVLLRNNITGIREHVTPLDTGTEFPQVDFAFVDKE